MADVEKHLLQVLDRDGSIDDSESFASTSGYDHKAVISSIKSLHSYEMIVAEVSYSASILVSIPPFWRAPLTVAGAHDDTWPLCLQEKSHSRYALTAEGKEVIEHGSPEFWLHSEVRKHENGISMKQLQVSLSHLSYSISCLWKQADMH